MNNLLNFLNSFRDLDFFGKNILQFVLYIVFGSYEKLKKVGCAYLGINKEMSKEIFKDNLTDEVIVSALQEIDYENMVTSVSTLPSVSTSLSILFGSMGIICLIYSTMPLKFYFIANNSLNLVAKPFDLIRNLFSSKKKLADDNSRITDDVLSDHHWYINQDIKKLKFDISGEISRISTEVNDQICSLHVTNTDLISHLDNLKSYLNKLSNYNTYKTLTLESKVNVEEPGSKKVLEELYLGYEEVNAWIKNATDSINELRLMLNNCDSIQPAQHVNSQIVSDVTKKYDYFMNQNFKNLEIIDKTLPNDLDIQNFFSSPYEEVYINHNLICNDSQNTILMAREDPSLREMILNNLTSFGEDHKVELVEKFNDINTQALNQLNDNTELVIQVTKITSGIVRTFSDDFGGICELAEVSIDASYLIGDELISVIQDHSNSSVTK